MQGIFEQQRFTQPYETVLNIDNTSFTDSSSYNHPISIIGSVPILDGGYRIQGNANYLSIPSHSAFTIGTKNYRISFEFRKSITGTGSTEESTFIGQRGSTDALTSFYVRIAPSNSAINLAFNRTGLVVLQSTTDYGLGFRDIYQKVVIEYRRSTPNANFKSAYFIDASNTVIAQNSAAFGNTASVATAFTIGGIYNATNADYVIKNIKFELGL